MRIVFIGTPDFAATSLKKLVGAGKTIVGVITAPDRPAGRKQQLRASAVKEYALEAGLKVLQPTNLKDPLFVDELKALNADLQIVVAFRMLPEVVWNMPPLGTFNLHASLLPNYRGAAPINHAIINGETETGVTTFFLKHKIDTGNILLQELVAINREDNAGTLHDKLMNTGAALLVKTCDLIEKGKVEQIPQESLVSNQKLSEAPKIFKDFCKIDWSNDATSIHNKIRGLSPYPCAFTEVQVGDKRLTLKIYEMELDVSEASDKAIQIDSTKNKLGIKTKGGLLWFKEVQLQGKKRMDISSLLNGIHDMIQIQF